LRLELLLLLSPVTIKKKERVHDHSRADVAAQVGPVRAYECFFFFILEMKLALLDFVVIFQKL
jgi:hypothetical protein